MTLQRRTLLAGGVSAMGLGLSGCAALGLGGWTTLVDGSSMTMADFAAWGKLGEGNWSMGEGTLQGRAGKMGYLVSPQTYTDFEIRAEFWADKPANSGIFIRCQDPKNVGAANSYEVNIFDTRPDPSYGTAAIVDFAKVAQPYPQAANQWNTFHITAKGDHLVVVFNGQKTVDIKNGKFRSGPVALQSAGGTIRWRKVEIRSI